MSSKQQPSSSEERTRKRKLSNRESARRSRMKKQQHLDELLAQERQITNENKKLSQTIDDTSQLYGDLASRNNVLRAQVAELTDRLGSLNSVLQIASEVFDIPDSSLEPWLLPCPIPPIPASAHKFNC
ncbi:ocs element-binding factor 1 [Dorcoceras hygrometricum]|uniref:Ocs element-binding factor 1 n=1 Tax=Dorcoceras hygrometricum TaxID=472368 RepID=A0A2Z7BZ51_9LAMI|nr:ocs element-binding factor 1 [Dorcoceras hygrometricum]